MALESCFFLFDIPSSRNVADNRSKRTNTKRSSSSRGEIFLVIHNRIMLFPGNSCTYNIFDNYNNRDSNRDNNPVFICNNTFRRENVLYYNARTKTIPNEE